MLGDQTYNVQGQGRGVVGSPKVNERFIFRELIRVPRPGSTQSARRSRERLGANLEEVRLSSTECWVNLQA